MDIKPGYTIDKILVCRPDRLGDVILTLPTVYSLHQAFPDARIWFLCNAYTSRILRSYKLINDLIIYDEYIKQKSIKGIRSLTNMIKSQKFDLALHLLPRFPLALATFLADVRFTIGTGFRWYSFLFTHRQYEHRKYNLYHEAEYNLRLLNKINIEPVRDSVVFEYFEFPAEIKKSTQKLIVQSFDTQPYILVHPGSGGSSIDWPIPHFIRLIRLLNQWGKYRIGLTGAASERTILEPFYKAGIDFVDFVGRLDLIQLALLSKRASLFLANSTGPLHLAVAMGTPVLGLFPDRPGLGPLRWGPWQQSSLYYLTPSAVGLSDKPGKSSIHESISQISAQDVFVRIRQILSS